MAKTNVNPCYLEYGEMKLVEADEFNVPVNCYIIDPWPDERYYHWYADNYLSQCHRVEEEIYHISSTDKGEILAAVRKYVVPLYQSAMKSLAQTGESKWR